MAMRWSSWTSASGLTASSEDRSRRTVSSASALSAAPVAVLDVLANDSDYEGGPLPVTIAQPPGHGTASCSTC